MTALPENRHQLPHALRRWLFGGLTLIVISGLYFHHLQNASAPLPGGKIALIKTLWLGTVLASWYLLPLLMLFDRRLEKLRSLVALLLLNMLIRAMVELGMMYLWHNWHPYYGIGHDLFSVMLCLVLATKVRRCIPIISTYFIVMAILFAVETGFAWYMLRHVSTAVGTAYYVPDSPVHLPVLVITAVAVTMTWAYLSYFIRAWLYPQQGLSSSARENPQSR
ncbi:hypothetical protein [Thiolapillus sp.]